MACIKPAFGSASGYALLECLIALLLFTAAYTGSMWAQVVAQRGTAEALQYSIATQLASDLLERVLINPAAVSAYLSEGLGDPARLRVEPAAHCRNVDCQPEQLAAYDLWQFEGELTGRNESVGAVLSGPLHEARACVRRLGNVVSVTVLWRGRIASVGSDADDCPVSEIRRYDAPGAPAGSGHLLRSVVLESALKSAPVP